MRRSVLRPVHDHIARTRLTLAGFSLRESQPCDRLVVYLRRWSNYGGASDRGARSISSSSVHMFCLPIPDSDFAFAFSFSFFLLFTGGPTLFAWTHQFPPPTLDPQSRPPFPISTSAHHSSLFHRQYSTLTSPQQDLNVADPRTDPRSPVGHHLGMLSTCHIIPSG